MARPGNAEWVNEMDETAARRILQAHMEAENGHLMAETLATLTAGCLFEDLPLGRVYRGHAGAAEYYRTWWDAFSTVAQPETLYLSGTGEAIAEVRFVGEHTGTFLGIEPSGRRIDLPTVIIVTFEDGLMAGERMYWDLGTLLRQLGRTALPPVSEPR